VLHLSKGKWEKLQRINLGMRLLIKSMRVLGKCAQSGLLKEIGRNWKEYRWIYFELIQEIKAWKPINASISSSATSKFWNNSTSTILRGANLIKLSGISMRTTIFIIDDLK